MIRLRVDEIPGGWRWQISGEVEASGVQEDRSEAIQAGHEQAHRLGLWLVRWDDERGVGEFGCARTK